MTFFDSHSVAGKLQILVRLSVLPKPSSLEPVTCFLLLNFCQLQPADVPSQHISGSGGQQPEHCAVWATLLRCMGCSDCEEAWALCQPLSLSYSVHPLLLCLVFNTVFQDIVIKPCSYHRLPPCHQALINGQSDILSWLRNAPVKHLFQALRAKITLYLVFWNSHLRKVQPPPQSQCSPFTLPLLLH